MKVFSYVSNEDLFVFSNNRGELSLLRNISCTDMTGEWKYDSIMTNQHLDEFYSIFLSDFTEKYHSFTVCEKTVQRCGRLLLAIAESNLFYVCVEDNEWSTAVELICKDDCNCKGLQMIWHETYIAGIKQCLLNQLDSVYMRSGPWTSIRVTK